MQHTASKQTRAGMGKYVCALEGVAAQGRVGQAMGAQVQVSVSMRACMGAECAAVGR